MSENSKTSARRLLRSQSVRGENTELPVVEATCTNQKKINFPIKKRSDICLGKLRKMADIVSLTTQSSKSPGKRQIQGQYWHLSDCF